MSTDFNFYGFIANPNEENKKCFPLDVSTFHDLSLMQYSLLKNIKFINDMILCQGGFMEETQTDFSEMLKSVIDISVQISYCLTWNCEALDELEKRQQNDFSDEKRRKNDNEKG